MAAKEKSVGSWRTDSLIGSFRASVWYLMPNLTPRMLRLLRKIDEVYVKVGVML